MKIGGKNVSNTLYIGGQRPFTSADKSNLDKNTSARHTHSNKSVLDGITEEKVSQWDAGGGSGKEDTSNKVQSLSDTSTGEQYPSAKATVDYVKQKVLRVYKYFGSITLHDLLHAHTVGSGTIYNMLDGGSRTFNISTTLGTARYYSGYITFPFPLPGEGFISVTLADGSTMQTYTLTNLIQTEYSPNVYSYKDADGVLSGYSGSMDFAIAELSYTLSVNPGDNVLSTGYYWDNLSSYVDLSGYAIKSDVNNSLETKSNEMKLLYTKKLTTDDGNVSFIEFIPEIPLKKIYVYTYCPKDTTANTNQLLFKFGSGSYVTDSVGHANIATDSAMWGIKELDLEHHKNIVHGAAKAGYPGSLQSRNNLYPYSGNNTFWEAIYDNSTFEVVNLLSGVKFSTNSDSVYFPLNTIMMVWGC